MTEDDRMDVLKRLEAGEISADEAIQALEEEPDFHPEGNTATESPSVNRWRSWWLIPLSLGIAGTAAGLGISQLGGWWWACAGPLLVVSVTVVTLAAAT
ncbi:MAG: hypothetical protein E4G99_13920, partial [Anaerolineales bacterium]